MAKWALFKKGDIVTIKIDGHNPKILSFKDESYHKSQTKWNADRIEENLVIYAGDYDIIADIVTPLLLI